MSTTTRQPTRVYFETVLVRYTRAKSEFLTAYEQLQSEGSDIAAQRQNALAALSNTDHLVRRAASRILVRHATALADHVDLLVARLKDYDDEVIGNLCAILGSLGGKAIKAVDALNWHIARHNKDLRLTAQKAMVAIIDDFGRGLCANMSGKRAALTRKF